MIKKTALLILSISLLASCDLNKDQSTIESYIQNFFGKEALTNNQLYVFIPKDVCPSCVESLIEYFNTFSNTEKNKVTGVFIGNTLKELEMLTDKLVYKGNILLDFKEEAFKTEIISPHYTSIYINRIDGKSEILEFPENNLYLITNQIDKFLYEN